MSEQQLEIIAQNNLYSQITGDDKQEFSKKPVGISIKGKILLGITGALAVGLTAICTPFITPALRRYCLPYIPATPKQIQNIIQGLKGRHGSVVDLGSGDGRIVLELAKLTSTSKSIGVELNPWLVLYSKLQVLRSGLRSKTEFYRHDLWKFNLKSYDNIVIFGVDQMMLDLEKKFEVECKNDCNVIACRFPLPNKQPNKIIGKGIDMVWIYEYNK